MNHIEPRMRMRLAAVVFGLVAGLALAEAGLRAFDLRPVRFPRPKWMVLKDGSFHDLGNSGGGLIKRADAFHDPAMRMGEYVPGAVFKHVYGSNPRGYFDADNGVEVRINSLGLRGPEVSRKKPAGVRRILGLGDSFTLGVGVREEDTFLRVLERSLNSGGGMAGPGSVRYEVLNAGVEGYGTYDEVRHLEAKWLGLDPDVILVVFYVNDVFNDWAFFVGGQMLGTDLLASGLARYSLVADHVQHALRLRRIRTKVESHYGQPFFRAPERFFSGPSSAPYDWHRAMASFDKAKALARARGIKLCVVLFPSLYKLEEGYPFKRVHEMVLAELDRKGIPALDLLPAFAGRKESGLWVHPSDHHPNEVAGRIAAHAMEPFLRKVLSDLAR